MLCTDQRITHFTSIKYTSPPVQDAPALICDVLKIIIFMRQNTIWPRSSLSVPVDGLMLNWCVYSRIQLSSAVCTHRKGCGVQQWSGDESRISALRHEDGGTAWPSTPPPATQHSPAHTNSASLQASIVRTSYYYRFTRHTSL